MAGAIAGQQTGALVDGSGDTTPLRAAIGLGVIAVPLPVARRRPTPAAARVPLALLVRVGLAAMLLGRDDLQLVLALGDAWSEAGLRASTAGVIAGGAAQALAEVLGGRDRGRHRSCRRARVGAGAHEHAGAGARRGPGAPAAASATATAPTRDSLVLPEPLPLERNYSRGLRPSQQVGRDRGSVADRQPLRDGGHYAFRIRGNPRARPGARAQGQRGHRGRRGRWRRRPRDRLPR
ncbi:MAG: hypothetical protein U0168_16560 [Nannocystaceae bacterium]